MWGDGSYGNGRGPQRNRWRKPTSEEILAVTGIVSTLLMTVAVSAGELAFFINLAAILVAVTGIDAALRAK